MRSASNSPPACGARLDRSAPRRPGRRPRRGPPRGDADRTDAGVAFAYRPDYLDAPGPPVATTLPLTEEPVLTPEAGGMNAPLSDANQAADVLIALRQSNLSIASATVQKPTLDEVFMAITGHGAEDETHEMEVAR